MVTQLWRSVVYSIIALVIFGFVFAFVGTGVAQLFFKHQADGSITPYGSTLIGQNWATAPCPGGRGVVGTCWFHGRPDDTGPYAANPKEDVSGGDNPLEANGVSGESGATNLGPRSKVLLENTEELIAYWHKLGVPDPTPDLVTTSGSGYDPDISPQDALVQVPMIANARHVSPAALRALIARNTQSEQLGFLGSSHINVLQLNEGLAKLAGS